MKLNNVINNIFKKNLLTTLFTLFFICLLLFPTSNLNATKNGITLWAKNVVPSLFPFFIATELLNFTNLPYYIGKLSNKLMKPLFNVPGIASYAFVMGIISGYPVGAKVVTKFLEDGLCTKDEAERMLAFTNNSSPLFIIGTVGITMFASSQIGIILFISHILSCLTSGIILGFISKTHSKPYSNAKSKNPNVYNTSISSNYKISDLGTIISTSITNSISTILLIGGFIVLFSIIVSILNNCNLISCISSILSFIGISKEYANGIIIGLIELTNGVNMVSCIHTKNISNSIIVTSFLLGFAGISIFLQIFSIATKNKLSMKPYLLGKLLQACFSAFYTFLIFKNFAFLNLDIFSF